MAWGRSVSTHMAVTEATISAKYLYARSNKSCAHRDLSGAVAHDEAACVGGKGQAAKGMGGVGVLE